MSMQHGNCVNHGTFYTNGGICPGCMSTETNIELADTLTNDLREQAENLAGRESNDWVEGLLRKSVARIEKLEEACQKAILELSSWDTKASKDQTTSIGYVVQTLRDALTPSAPSA